jgi:hypothetical protein
MDMTESPVDGLQSTTGWSSGCNSTLDWDVVALLLMHLRIDGYQAENTVSIITRLVGIILIPIHTRMPPKL